jgi:Replication-relaxation
LGGQAHVLKPDSYVRLGAGDYEDSFFIEVDRGTEGSRALTGKLEQYVAYAANGKEQTEHGVSPKVLWLAPDERRVGVIQDCVMALPPRASELFEVARFVEAMTAIRLA